MIPAEPWRTYADPFVADPSTSYEDRRRAGRALRDAVPYDVALSLSALDGLPSQVDRVGAAVVATGATGLVVSLVGDSSVGNFAPVALDGRLNVCDARSVDDALPGPWECDLASLALSVGVAEERRAKRADLVEAVAVGYREGVEALATVPLHAAGDVARARATARVSGVDPDRVATYATAEGRLVEGDARPRLRSGQLASMWAAPVAEAPEELTREFTQYRETVVEPFASLLMGYPVMDARVAEDGRAMILLARDAPSRHGRDVVLVEGVPVSASPLEAVLGAWRQGSDVQRVLDARERLPLAPAAMLGWSTSRDGSIARAWSRPRLSNKPLAPSVTRKRARSAGFTLGLIHARTGDPVALSGYLGKSDRFPKALVASVAEVFASA